MGEAKRRKETGAPPPQKGKSNKLLYAGIGLLALAAVLPMQSGQAAGRLF